MGRLMPNLMPQAGNLSRRSAICPVWLKFSCAAGGGWKLAGLALAVQQGFGGFASKDTASIDYSADQTPGQRLTQVCIAATSMPQVIAAKWPHAVAPEVPVHGVNSVGQQMHGHAESAVMRQLSIDDMGSMASSLLHLQPPLVYSAPEVVGATHQAGGNTPAADVFPLGGLPCSCAPVHCCALACSRATSLQAWLASVCRRFQKSGMLTGCAAAASWVGCSQQPAHLILQTGPDLSYEYPVPRGMLQRGHGLQVWSCMSS